MDTNGFIYVMGAQGYYKIGHAIDVKKRAARLRTQLPWPIEILHTIPCEDCAAAEKILHQRFAHRRANGEWFWLADDDLEAIRSIDSIDTSFAGINELRGAFTDYKIRQIPDDVRRELFSYIPRQRLTGLSWAQVEEILGAYARTDLYEALRSTLRP